MHFLEHSLIQRCLSIDLSSSLIPLSHPASHFSLTNTTRWQQHWCQVRRILTACSRCLLTSWAQRFLTHIRTMTKKANRWCLSSSHPPNNSPPKIQFLLMLGKAPYLLSLYHLFSSKALLLQFPRVPVQKMLPSRIVLLQLIVLRLSLPQSFLQKSLAYFLPRLFPLSYHHKVSLHCWQLCFSVKVRRVLWRSLHQKKNVQKTRSHCHQQWVL